MLEFKLGDRVQWPTHDVGGFNLPAGNGIVAYVLSEASDGMNYLIIDNEGDEVYPFNHVLSYLETESEDVSEPNAMSTKTLNGNDLGKVVRVPTRTGLVVQGTLRKVSHCESEIVVGFEETSSTYYADIERDFEYVWEV